MKRRDFITISAAVSSGAFFCLPGSAILCPPGRKFKDPMVWFKENYHWLKGWLDTAKSYDDYEEMQIFKTPSCIYKTFLIEKVRQFDYKKDPNVCIGLGTGIGVGAICTYGVF